MAGNPFAGLVSKLNAGQNVVVQHIGDSVSVGYEDTDLLNGYIGRLWLSIGQTFGVSVRHHIWDWGTDAYLTDNSIWNWQNSTFINGAAVDYDPPSGPTTNTLTWWNFAAPAIANITYLQSYGQAPIHQNADLIFAALGFDDLTAYGPGQFETNLLTYLAQLQSWCPGVPILYVTENQSMPPLASYAAYGGSVAEDYFNAATNALVGLSLPLNPVMIASAAMPGVTVLDTQQAFASNSTDVYSLLHPSAAGSVLLADLVLQQVPSPQSGTAATIATTPGVPAVLRTAPPLPANWTLGDSWTAADQNNVAATVNALRVAVTQLGAQPPAQMMSNWQSGQPFTADAANAVGAAVNSLATTVATLGGTTVSPVKADWAPSSAYTSDDQNRLESTLNALSASVAQLQSGL